MESAWYGMDRRGEKVGLYIEIEREGDNANPQNTSKHFMTDLVLESIDRSRMERYYKYLQCISPVVVEYSAVSPRLARTESGGVL